MWSTSSVIVPCHSSLMICNNSDAQLQMQSLMLLSTTNSRFPLPRRRSHTLTYKDSGHNSNFRYVSLCIFIDICYSKTIDFYDTPKPYCTCISENNDKKSYNDMFLWLYSWMATMEKNNHVVSTSTTSVNHPTSVPVRVAHELYQAGHRYLDVRLVLLIFSNSAQIS